MQRAAITGWGRCTPGPVLTNERSGVGHGHHRRMDHHPVRNQGTAHLSRPQLGHGNACRAPRPGRSRPRGRRIWTTSSSPPAQATARSRRWRPWYRPTSGLQGVAAIDANAGCTGFIYGLNLANGLIATGSAERILLIGSERIAPFLDLEERSTAVLFGDGAGAAVIEAAKGDEGLISINVGADGTIADALTCQGVGSSFIGEPTGADSDHHGRW